MFFTTRERPGAPSLSAKARNIALAAVAAGAIAFGGGMMHHASTVTQTGSATHTTQAAHQAPLACGGLNLPCIPIRP